MKGKKHTINYLKNKIMAKKDNYDKARIHKKD